MLTNDQDDIDFSLRQSLMHDDNETLTSKIHQVITSKDLSQDKLCVLPIMQKHFINVKSGYASGMLYTAPILLITGSSVMQKSLLITTITELSELIGLDVPIKTAFMGIAALNMDGYTMNSFFDIPREINEGSRASKNITLGCR